jgi:ELWxxDGT repeat protein
MKQASAVLFALMMITVSLAGCFGGDDGNSNDETPTETPTDLQTDWQVHFAASAADLPICNDDTNGRLYYIEADTEFHVCKTSGWEIIEITGPNGATGSSGANGTTGTDGQNGADGADGTDGQNGENGMSILITIHNSTSCTTGGNTFEIGSDSSGDGVLDVTEVSVIMDICNGAQGTAGANGTNGINGTNALNPLITSFTEPAGSNCANGGTRIDVGVDDNADAVLSANEIDQTQYVCNSIPYNNIMLTSITTHPASMACDVGGRVVSYGLDNGDGGGNSSNGVLESGEIDSSIIYCSYVSTVNSASPNYLTASGNTLYFQANDVTNGYELWKSDGTAAGTVMVKDINNGSGSSFTYSPQITAIGNTLYFSAYDATNGYELWKSDGTAAGTVMVKDINSIASFANNGPSGSGLNSYNVRLTAIGNTLYFSATDGTNGTELWKSDGTAAGTVMVKDINNGSGSSFSSFSQLTAVGNTLYFQANDGTNGSELWKSDGTAAGTVMVKDIYTNTVTTSTEVTYS